MAEQPDYVITYDKFWKDLVEHPDGTLNRDQLMRELADYHAFMGSASEVYSHVTGDRISKVNTAAHAVISVADERVDELLSEELRDIAEELAHQEKDAPREGLAAELLKALAEHGLTIMRREEAP
ncbi:hypothetical protein [Streptosporangium sp. G12]